MDKNQSAVDSFLKGIDVDGSQSFNTEEPLKDPFVQEEVQDEPIIEEPKEEKPLPFNKDPKVLKFIEKELNKRLADIKPAESQQVQQKDNDEVVDALSAVIGNDTPEKRRAVQALRDRLDESANEVRQWKEQQYQADVADQQAEEELETAFENIEEQFDVDITSNTATARKTRQEFVTFVEKIAPKDRNGDIIDYPDMTSAFETFQEIKRATTGPSRAKELASRGMARSSEAVSQGPQKRITFDDFDNLIAGK